MKLMVVRHAQAEDKDAYSDDDMRRPLTRRGRQVARRFFKKLAKRLPVPAIIYSSEAVRASETAHLLAKAFGKVTVQECAELNPGMKPGRFMDWFRKVPGNVECAAIVGHEPDLSNTVSEITANGCLRVELRKSACVGLEVNRIGKGQLEFLIPPDFG